MSTEIAKREGKGGATRPPTGLLLSIGDTTTSRGGREIPTRIDWFRVKEGQLGQYAAAAATYRDVYGEQPKQLDDVYFLSDNLIDVLDIRLMAWGSSGIRLIGDTNYAGLPRDEWEERAFSFDDDITFFPLEVKEVPRDRQAAWKGEPVRGRLTGPDDPRIKKLEIGVHATLTFCLPKVMGFGTVAQITTKSKRSMRNLVSSLNDQRAFFQGQLIGIPFRLKVRPARGRRFDQEQRRMIPFEFFELVLDTPFTVQEAIDAIRTRREALGAGQPGPGSPEARALTSALALPAGDETEKPQVREEPEAGTTLDDALLNRIAHLEQQVGEGALVTLRGVFNVETASQLNPAEAAQYEQFLTRAVPAETIDDAEIVFDDPGPEDESFDFAARAEEAQTKRAETGAE